MRLILPALLLGAGQIPAAAVCSQPLSFYDIHRYYVADVRVQSTLGFIKSALMEVDTSSLRLHKRKKNDAGNITDPGMFSIVALSLDTRTIKQKLESNGDRINIAVAVPAVEECDDRQLSLKVVYRVYLLNIPVEETGVATVASTVLRSLIPSNGVGEILKTAFPSLLVGYDHTHRLFGGTNTVLKSNPGGLFDTMRLRAVGSSSSSSVEAGFSGARDFSSSKIAHADWAMGYSLSDEPTGVLQIKQSKAFGRAGITTGTTPNGLTWHFGSAVEGGNEQTNVSTTIAPGVARSPYGALKMYAAVDARPRGNPLSISYGAQLGKAAPGVNVDYSKQIVEIVQSAEFFPNKDRHKAFSLEARFTAGFSTGELPLAERFFGGNRERYFIDGDSWRILDQPFIRSFSANRLTLPDAGMYGGDSFLSANATLSYPVFYHRPLVPTEILEDPTFDDMLAGALATPTNALANHYITLAPQFVALRKDVLALAEPLRALRQILTQLNAAGIPAAATNDANADLDSVETAFMQMGDPTLGDPSAPLVTAAVGFPKMSVDADLITLADDLQTVIDAMPGSMASQKADLQQRQANFRNAVLDPITGFTVRFQNIDMTIPKKKAANDMKVPASVLHRFIHELNLASISPVVMLDAARINSNLVMKNPGWRYGIGPGIRFSLVNVNFTLGYSFNVRRLQNDPVGAFNIGMTFGDLFR